MGKRERGRFLAMLLLALLLCPTQAAAAESVRAEQPASLTVCYRWDGAQFELYRVAEVSAAARFTASGDFEGFAGLLNGLDGAEAWDMLAQDLLAFAEDRGIKPLARAEIKGGSCRFDALQTGLYLVVGHETRVGRTVYTCKPFVLCLPGRGDTDGRCYDVTASPKYGKPETPTDPVIPQTGQLWWPVPLLLLVGTQFFVLGLLRRRGGRR